MLPDAHQRPNASPYLGFRAGVSWSKIGSRSLGLARVGTVYHGDIGAKVSADLSVGIFAGIARELKEVGAEAVPVVYNDAFVDEFMFEAIQLGGMLVRVSPVEGGRDRPRLNA